ncbi:hypothetical protein P8625_02440 [Tenacibaculum tangerinum]|uniref:Glycoside hydrolase family 2 catalytic domain-containing protein n=1 Tax=Tenacibaculum tangerinum TaxID=3038772 RepID=A0ABY8L782_9FLAO|nr:hypothetical protein [Tenacibaculum tangerinum]WGH76048.1 hypothetical protein P8625_02440 [Tenacibaculum tangerinum]
MRLAVLTYTLLLTIILLGCQKTKENTISVSERQILVNLKPYTIKGVCYHPVPKGSSNKRSFSNLKEDVLLMKEAGINTIRVYEPIKEVEVLDFLAKNQLKVIIGFGYDQGGVYDIKSGSYLQYIKKYRHHKAILMWELGNEYNYHPEWFGNNINNWYSALKEAVDTIHKYDSNHPVATAHGELPNATTLAMVPNIDVWGMNVYRWDKPASIFEEWKKISNKPMYLSEAGADSYMTIEKQGYIQGENQKAQADATRNILNDVFENSTICAGVALFSFTDGWWKAGSLDTQDIGGWAPNSSGVPYDGTPNEEYWGIVDIDRNKKKVFEVVTKFYTDTKEEY